ncbi:MAG: peptidylprolyl isomerase [Lachnospiraceae bacterium]|nr:peptidylprolyl isomerase [Lachnospiraceae bacterium]
MRKIKKCFLCFCLIMCLLTCSCGKNKKDVYAPEGNDLKEKTLSDAAQDYYQYRYPVEGQLCADIFILDYGHIYVRLFDEDAPGAVENFRKKAEKGDYTGSLISKAVKDYYVQGGKPLTEDTKEESIWGGGFTNEISDRLVPTRGALCMANQGKNGTNAQQFFFVTTAADTIKKLDDPLNERYGISLKQYLADTYGTELEDKKLARFLEYGGAPWIYGHNTVFGQVFKGFDVLDAVEADAAKGKQEIYIKKITVYKYV